MKNLMRQLHRFMHERQRTFEDVVDEVRTYVVSAAADDEVLKKPRHMGDQLLDSAAAVVEQRGQGHQAGRKTVDEMTWCRFLLTKGECNRWDPTSAKKTTCNFRHAKECSAFQAGKCRYGEKCKFLHRQKEKTQTTEASGSVSMKAEASRTEGQKFCIKCFDAEKGTFDEKRCSKGAKCKFRHGRPESAKEWEALAKLASYLKNRQSVNAVETEMALAVGEISAEATWAMTQSGFDKRLVLDTGSTRHLVVGDLAEYQYECNFRIMPFNSKALVISKAGDAHLVNTLGYSYTLKDAWVSTNENGLSLASWPRLAEENWTMDGNGNILRTWDGNGDFFGECEVVQRDDSYSTGLYEQWVRSVPRDSKFFKTCSRARAIIMIKRTKGSITCMSRDWIK